jgi:riboflavin synthase alpha subunit
MSHTNLGALQIRDRVNLECDMVGKYVVRAAELAGLTIHGLRPGEVAH